MTKMQNSNLVLFIKKYQTLLAFTAIGLSAMVLLRSAFYGIGTPDESFYLTIPYRLIKGDSLLVDEWHASQFSAFLLYLPMKLFLQFTGSTNGIILYFRCLFVFCQTAVSIFTFCKLKKYGTVPALVSALIFLLYVPEEVKMLDYYTMSLMGFQVVALILFCTEKLKTYHYLFAGIVFACAVTAQPFNCLIYFIYSFAVLFYFLNKKKKAISEWKEKYLSVKPWLYITVGISCVAIAFCVFLFAQITLNELIDNLENLFGGHDHTLPFSQSTGETDMFSYSTLIKTFFEFIPIGFTLSTILFVALYFDKKLIKNRKKWIKISSAVLIILVIEFIVSLFTNPVSTLFRPYLLFAVTFICLMLTDKKDKNLFAICYTGIAYIVFLGIISQAMNYIGVIGLVISSCVLAPSFKQLYNEIKPGTNKNLTDKKRVIVNNISKNTLSIVCIIIAFIVLFDITVGFSIKLVDDATAAAFNRESLSADTIIDEGPLKGIHVNHELSDSYNDILTDLKSIKENSCENVLVASLIPWIYFYFDGTPATFTTWYIKEELDLFDDYYQNKEKIPKCIYIPKTAFFWSGTHTNSADFLKEFFSQMFSAESIQGKSGHIIYVK